MSRRIEVDATGVALGIMYTLNLTAQPFRKMSRRNFLVSVGAAALAGCMPVGEKLATHTPPPVVPSPSDTPPPPHGSESDQPLPLPQTRYPTSLELLTPSKNRLTLAELLDPTNPERARLAAAIIARWDAILGTHLWEKVVLSSDEGWTILAKKDARFAVPRTWSNPDQKSGPILILDLSPYRFLDKPDSAMGYVTVNDPPGMEGASFEAAIYNGWPMITAQKGGERVFLDASADRWKQFSGTEVASPFDQAIKRLNTEVAKSNGAYRLAAAGSATVRAEALRAYPKPPHTWPEPTPAPTPSPEWDSAVELGKDGAKIRITDFYQGGTQSEILIPAARFSPAWNAARGELTVTDPATGKEYAFNRVLKAWTETELRPGVPATWEVANWVDGERLKKEGLAYVREYTDALIPLERAYMVAKYPDLPKTLTSGGFGSNIDGEIGAPFQFTSFDNGRNDQDPPPILSVSRIMLEGHQIIVLGVPVLLRRKTGIEYSFDDVAILHLMLEDDGTFEWCNRAEGRSSGWMNQYMKYYEINIIENQIAKDGGNARIRSELFVWVNPANEPALNMSGNYNENPELAKELGYVGASIMFKAWNTENFHGTAWGYNQPKATGNVTTASLRDALIPYERYFFPVFRFSVLSK